MELNKKNNKKIKKIIKIIKIIIELIIKIIYDKTHPVTKELSIAIRQSIEIFLVKQS